MTKTFVAVVALLGVALWTGCATGGGGHTMHITLASSQGKVIAVTLTSQFTATVTGTDNHAVTWSVKGDGCTGNACGTIDASGLYTAPATAPNPTKVTITATSQANSNVSASLAIDVIQVFVIVTPKINNTQLDVAKGLAQQFTAAAQPDDKRAQSFTWSLTCDAGANLCGTIDAGTGLYTAPNTVPSPATAHITATSTIDATGTDTVDVTIRPARLAVGSTYAFHITGFDANGAMAIAGNFATNGSGAIIGGTQDELTTTQHNTRTITSGSLSADNNGHATLTLNTSAGARTYKIAFNANGDGKMIEFDSVARSSGRIVLANAAKFKNSALPSGSTFVLGVQGIDEVLDRIGLVGLFKPDGAGGINSGLLDINDHGVLNLKDAVDGASSSYNIQSDGRGLLSLTDNATGNTYNYAIYVTTGITNKASNPLTLFVISADDPQVNPAVSGEIVFQDPTSSYVNADFKTTFVAGLTGVNGSGHSLASISLASGNGQSSCQLQGAYDANNAGTIVAAKSISAYACNADPINTGRYELDLLSDPKTHFVLYSTADSRGFLLQIDSTNNPGFVYFGRMEPQPGGLFAASEMAGSYVGAISDAGTGSVAHPLDNFLFTSLQPDLTVGGKQDEADGGLNAGQTVSGTYTLEFGGTGTIKLTQPSARNYVIYALDNPKIDTRKDSTMNQHFVMLDVDTSNTDPGVIFAER